MQTRPRRLMKQLSQRTGTSWFRGPNLILVCDCGEPADIARQPGATREEDDGLGLDYNADSLRRTGPYIQ